MVFSDLPKPFGTILMSPRVLVKFGGCLGLYNGLLDYQGFFGFVQKIARKSGSWTSYLRPLFGHIRP
jgi:hypothetical protein